ncbi:MAG: KpsF/GutQ family sugar-phosphate isomerase [Thermodesulfobacteriota bacterium]
MQEKVLKEILRHAREVIQIEAEAIQGLLERLDANFARAVEILLACKGRVIVTGIGKSGLVGRKIAATLTSTGTPAVFLHPVEGLHGDLGMVTPQDVIIAISNSGETTEIINLLPALQKIGAKIISLTGALNSTLARHSLVAVDVGVEREACPLGLAPTSSTTATLVMGDALAIALMRQKKFAEKDFALFHPGGSLGERLALQVKEIMHPLSDFPVLSAKATVQDLLQVFHEREEGLVLIFNEENTLAGMVTDRELKRGNLGSPHFLAQKIADFMITDLPALEETTSIGEAWRLFGERKLFAMPVVDKEKKLKGMITLQDILQCGKLKII